MAISDLQLGHFNKPFSCWLQETSGPVLQTCLEKFQKVARVSLRRVTLADLMASLLSCSRVVVKRMDKKYLKQIIRDFHRRKNRREKENKSQNATSRISRHEPSSNIVQDRRQSKKRSLDEKFARLFGKETPPPVDSVTECSFASSETPVRKAPANVESPIQSLPNLAQDPTVSPQTLELQTLQKEENYSVMKTLTQSTTLLTDEVFCLDSDEESCEPNEKPCPKSRKKNSFLIGTKRKNTSDENKESKIPRLNENEVKKEEMGTKEEERDLLQKADKEQKISHGSITPLKLEPEKKHILPQMDPLAIYSGQITSYVVLEEEDGIAEENKLCDDIAEFQNMSYADKYPSENLAVFNHINKSVTLESACSPSIEQVGASLVPESLEAVDYVLDESATSHLILVKKESCFMNIEKEENLLSNATSVVSEESFKPEPVAEELADTTATTTGESTAPRVPSVVRKEIASECNSVLLTDQRKTQPTLHEQEHFETQCRDFDKDILTLTPLQDLQQKSCDTMLEIQMAAEAIALFLREKALYNKQLHEYKKLNKLVISNSYRMGLEKVHICLKDMVKYAKPVIFKFMLRPDNGFLFSTLMSVTEKLASETFGMVNFPHNWYALVISQICNSVLNEAPLQATPQTVHAPVIYPNRHSTAQQSVPNSYPAFSHQKPTNNSPQRRSSATATSPMNADAIRAGAQQEAGLKVRASVWAPQAQLAQIPQPSLTTPKGLPDTLQRAQQTAQLNTNYPMLIQHLHQRLKPSIGTSNGSISCNFSETEGRTQAEYQIANANYQHDTQKMPAKPRGRPRKRDTLHELAHSAAGNTSQRLHHQPSQQPAYPTQPRSCPVLPPSCPKPPPPYPNLPEFYPNDSLTVCGTGRQTVPTYDSELMKNMNTSASRRGAPNVNLTPMVPSLSQQRPLNPHVGGVISQQSEIQNQPVANERMRMPNTWMPCVRPQQKSGKPNQQSSIPDQQCYQQYLMQQKFAKPNQPMVVQNQHFWYLNQQFGYPNQQRRLETQQMGSLNGQFASQNIQRSLANQVSTCPNQQWTFPYQQSASLDQQYHNPSWGNQEAPELRYDGSQRTVAQIQQLVSSTQRVVSPNQKLASPNQQLAFPNQRLGSPPRTAQGATERRPDEQQRTVSRDSGIMSPTNAMSPPLVKRTDPKTRCACKARTGSCSNHRCPCLRSGLDCTSRCRCGGHPCIPAASNSIPRSTQFGRS